MDLDVRNPYVISCMQTNMPNRVESISALDAENPHFTDAEMEQVGNLYRIPLQVRKDAAHASSVRFGYDWPPELTDLKDFSVVMVNRLYYQDDDDGNRIKMLNLRVLNNCTVEIDIKYEAFMNMHKLNRNGHDLIDINLESYKLDTGRKRMSICPLLGPSGDPEFTDKEMKAVGDLYLIPRKVRQAAAHVSCVAFGYEWPRPLTILRKDTILKVTRLFYQVGGNPFGDTPEKESRAKMIELRVVDENLQTLNEKYNIIRMHYEEFMHMHRPFGTGYESIDVSQYRLNKV